MNREYHVYMLTNFNKTVLYIGVTNNLSRRLSEHISGNTPGFTAKYNCKFLIYYESFQYINSAIAREKELKTWPRAKKELLISGFNPEWKFLNDRFVR